MRQPAHVEIEAIARLQSSSLCTSITCMIRHNVARKAKVIFDHPHNADVRASFGRRLTAVGVGFCATEQRQVFGGSVRHGRPRGHAHQLGNVAAHKVTGFRQLDRADERVPRDLQRPG